MGARIIQLMPRAQRTPDTHPHADIGERLKFVREFFELSQPEMAEKAGVSLGTYNNWETGLARISLTGARKLKQKLQLSLDFIVDGDTTALSAMLSRAWLSRS